jgi:hypothetical protein
LAYAANHAATLGRWTPRCAAMVWWGRACPRAARDKAGRRCRLVQSGSLCLRRCQATTLATILGIALLIPMLLQLVRIEEQNIECIIANRKPYYK